MSRLSAKEVKRKWKLNLRPDTSDLHTMQENDYEICEFKETDRWLDAGANIGTFGLKYGHKVEIVVSVEADEENYRITQNHYFLNNVHNAIAVRGALVSNNEKFISFYQCDGKGKSMHSTLPIRGRREVRVPAININTVLKMHKINKIKMDVEGSEWDLIRGIDDWTPIDEIIFEYHSSFLKDKDLSKLDVIKGILAGNGFQLLTENVLRLFGDERCRVIHAKKIYAE